MSTKPTKQTVSPDTIFTPQTELEHSWWDYHAKRPHVLAAFRGVAEDLLAGGKKREGAKAVAELVRHHRTHDGKPIKITSVYISYYARYLAASDDRFKDFFQFCPARPPKKPPITPGFAELLASTQAEEARCLLIALSNARGDNSEMYAEVYYDAFVLNFPKVAEGFPLPTDDEVAEYNSDLQGIPYTKFELWMSDEDIDTALGEHLTELRHEALKACGGSPLVDLIDGCFHLRKAESDAPNGG